jgi:hypothetical protein
MDTQTIELIGQHRLASELLRAGLEVAFPARDRGIDLIAYADLDRQLGRFVARPIQMKAASKRSFGIWKKYLKIHDLIVAFVWHLDGQQLPETYALTCAEAVTIADAMGWTSTISWCDNGEYATTNPGKDVCELLQPFRMSAEQWWAKVTATDSTIRT